MRSSNKEATICSISSHVVQVIYYQPEYHTIGVVSSQEYYLYRSNDIHLSDHRYILLLIWFSQDSALTGIFYLNHSLWQWLQNNIQIPVPPPYLSVSIQHSSLTKRPSFSISYLLPIRNHEFSFIFQRFIIHYCI